jgi:hypothetical protein
MPSAEQEVRMRKLLFAGIVLAAPLLGWQSAQASLTAPMTGGTNPVVAPNGGVQNVAWVWVGGRRVWHPYWVYGAWHPYWHPYWRPWVRVGYWHHWVPGHWAWGHWVPGHYA